MSVLSHSIHAGLYPATSMMAPHPFAPSQSTAPPHIALTIIGFVMSAEKPHSMMPPKRAGSSDIFSTPAHETARLFPYIPKHWKIWENASGEGHIVKALQAGGYETIGTDIMHGFDFLSPLMAPDFDFDMVLTNPPYSIKDEWLERCYEIGKPFALLMPITALGEQYRVSLYKKHGIQVALPPGRINFGTPSGGKSSAWFYAAWFCHGLDLPSQIHVLD